MKSLFDQVSIGSSRLTTKTYSTSFSLGILFLAKKMRNPIYAIYGFVRFADEIVDSFHDYNKKELLDEFTSDTWKAIRDGISLNPILNSFQDVVRQYNIRHEWIEKFLRSMEMDLDRPVYDEEKYREYIFGSAEAVGLMCLHVFTEKNETLFEELRPHAMRLGAAFQKVNFLRDAQADSELLGRTYFPGVEMRLFSEDQKRQIEADIEADFRAALVGIRRLPNSSKNGVYLAYYYYWNLFRKIKRLPAERILQQRIRIPNAQKLLLMLKSNLKYKLNIL